jgi:hypothetical protein
VQDTKEDKSIKELMHTSTITKEKLQNLKIDITFTIEDIRMEPENGIHFKIPVDTLDNLEYTTIFTLEELKKFQKRDMFLLQ